MNIQIGLVAPTALVVATAGWACWSQLGAPVSEPTKKPDEVARVNLEPDFGAPPGRDPFRLLVGELDEAHGPAARAVKTGPSLWQRIRQAVAAMPRPAHAADPHDAAKAADALARLPLAATSIHNGKQHAVIAGRAYTVGERVDAPGVDPRHGPVVLAEVRADGVLLAHRGETFAVKFPHATAASQPPGPMMKGVSKAKKAKPKSTGGVIHVTGKPR